MRFAALRRTASFVLVMVWAVARLAQPLQAACPHHMPALPVADAVAVDEAAGAHAHHEAPAPTHDHDAPLAACECASHCCAAVSISMPEAPEPLAVGRVAQTATWRFDAPRAPVVLRWAHRPPPANAPPGLRTV
ncbi:MAG: hypothetical protein ACOVRP_02600 [Gemmatimonas sp.]